MTALATASATDNQHCERTVLRYTSFTDWVYFSGVFFFFWEAARVAQALWAGLPPVVWRRTTLYSTPAGGIVLVGVLLIAGVGCLSMVWSASGRKSARRPREKGKDT